MDMEMMEMMMHYHHDLYRLNMNLANQYNQMSQTQREIANLNYEMYMHMMNHMPNQNDNCNGMNYHR